MGTKYFDEYTDTGEDMLIVSTPISEEQRNGEARRP